ncbi:hypothetical protein HDF09_004143 [Edaphobacter lichenicola]|uniref:Uncharacterized protein n=1 Tax=Tunturiibacter empetritectus TaxID=3069691 RepID=A0A7W8MU17_9BACT|nr:hypothetical protein [Edaphobacter lichenicola]
MCADHSAILELREYAEWLDKTRDRLCISCRYCLIKIS